MHVSTEVHIIILIVHMLNTILQKQGSSTEFINRYVHVSA